MKKNLISIVILALLIVNIVLTSIMMISVVSTNKKTAALVSDVAAAVKLDLGTEQSQAAVSIEDTATYTIADLTILLKRSTVINEDGVAVEADKDHYALISVTLSMNTKHEDYATFGADIASREDLIKGTINEVVRRHTMEEASADQQMIEDEILREIQNMFGSDFIYDVTLPQSLYQ